MPRKIERIDARLLGKGIGIEQPVIEIAAKAMYEQYDIVGGAALDVAQTPCRRVDELITWAGIVLALLRRRNDIGADKFIDIGVRHIGIGDDADQCLDRIDRVRL